MSPLLFALADNDRLPNYDALVLSPGVGWLLFAAVLCLCLFFAAHREAWHKFFLRLEDPRPLGAMRILFGICALCNVLELWELYEYLFMDSGIFTTDIAQHYRARAQFAAFGDGMSADEPWGFFGEWGTWAWFESRLTWLEGPNYSPLLFNSTPEFFWGYFTVFCIAMAMFIVGFQTRWVKWVAWFLFMGIILRNTLFWEATENVYRVFWFYLLLADCGAGWSVDNWLRVRKLRRQGRLSEPGKAGEGAGAVVEDEREDDEGAGPGARRVLEPIFKPIARWPRMLVILNVAMLYCATGTLKNGPVWNRGDAFYYAFNLDHFYRLPPQQLSAIFGTTLFRVNTWVVHWWEACFPLLILSLVIRWYRREKLSLTPRQTLMTRLGLGGFVFFFYLIILYSYPVHYLAPKKGLRFFPGGKVYIGEEAIPPIQWIVGICVPILAALVVLGYRALRNRRDTPPEERTRYRVLEPLLGRLVKLSFLPAGLRAALERARERQAARLPWFDLDWVCRWILGRRIWLMLGFIFHGHLILTMNIGWFSPGLLACYVAFLNGDELAFLTTKVGQFFHQRFKIPMPAHVRAGDPIPSADPALPHLPEQGWKSHRDGFRQSVPVLLTSFGLVLTAIFARLLTDDDMWLSIGNTYEAVVKESLPADLIAQTPELDPNWFVLMIALLVLITSIRRKRGWEFNPYFGPVIIGTAALGAYLAAGEQVAMIWVVLAVAVLSLGACRVKAEQPAPVPLREPDTGVPTRPWAYGLAGRGLVTVFIIYHGLAVISTQFPEKDSWWTFRSDINKTFRYYLQTTQTSQGWGMFAPNPPRSNVFLRVTVTDKDGEIYDLNTDVYACFMAQNEAEKLNTAEAIASAESICAATYPLPWIWYSRQRKMNRRIGGSEGGHGSWYQKWHTRWVCRDWERQHGELPNKVTLYKVTYPMLSPNEVVFNKPYDPRTLYNKRGSHKELYSTECKTTVGGQLTNDMRERYGMEEVDDKKVRQWNKNRCKKWEEQLIKEAREQAAKRGEEIDVLDPKFDVCPAMTREVKKAAREQGRDDLLEALEALDD